MRLLISFKNDAFGCNTKNYNADTPAPYSPVLLKWLPSTADDVIKTVKKIIQIINTVT
jgi:hypothetical protein